MSGLINSAGSRSGVIGTTELDYEEGLFTWTLKDGSCTWNTVSNYTQLHYIKIGKLVTVHGRFETNSSSGTKSGVTPVYITLPFTVASPGDNSGASQGSGSLMRGGNSVTGSPRPTVNNGSTSANWLIPHPNTSGSTETYVYGDQLDDSLEGYITITYTVA